MKRYVFAVSIMSLIVMLLSSQVYSKSKTITNLSEHAIRMYTTSGYKKLPAFACAYVPKSQFPVKIVGHKQAKVRCKHPGNYSITILDGNLFCSHAARALRCRHLNY